MKGKVFAAMLVGVSACATGQGEPAMSVVRSLVSQLRAAEGPARADMASELAVYTTTLTAEQRRQVSKEDVDEIAALLTDVSKTVRYFAATSLGNLGPEARRAIPALRAAIESVRAEERTAFIKPAISGAYPFYVAIHKIIGEPVPDDL